MKYQIIEETLNEYVNHPSETKIGEVEAKNRAEATEKARQMFPNSVVRVEPIS